MNKYKHTQIGYLTIVVAVVVLIAFVLIYTKALAEAPSVDSGPNFAISLVMVTILVLISSFTTLAVSIDEEHIRIKFGFGIFHKKFPLKEIDSVRIVKNHWYYGWGVKLWLWPVMWIYSVSGLKAVELKMKNGKIYRIGTDEPTKLEEAIIKHEI